MPKSCARQPHGVIDLVAKFRDELQAERQQVTTYLEEHHSVLLARLAERCGTANVGLPATFPDLGPDVEFAVDAGCNAAYGMMQTDSEQSMNNAPSKQPTKLTSEIERELDIAKVKKSHVQRRLHARLGPFGDADLVSASTLCAALEATSWKSFDVNDIQRLVLDLRREFVLRSDSSPASPVGTAARKSFRKSFNDLRDASGLSKKLECSIPFGCLVNVLRKSPDEISEHLDKESAGLLSFVRDVLLSSDASCMVAEMLSLRADDVASKTQGFSSMEIFEPCIAVVVIASSIMIGVNTNPRLQETDGMFASELVFTTIFTVELFLRAWHSGSLREYFCGHDRYWNFLDISNVGFSWLDAGLHIFGTPDRYTSSLLILRLGRLSRLIRMVKILRLDMFSEIVLMIQGLLVGVRTLFWAVVLLLFVLYAVSIFITMSVGQDERSDTFDRDRREYFSTLSRTAFTTFRCTMVVDCSSINGPSLLISATRRYGWVVAFCYTIVFLLINIGLLNLIMAVFIENTLKQAKDNECLDRVKYNRESIRVARHLKKLLVLISQSARSSSYQDALGSSDNLSLHTGMGSGVEELEVSREVFLSVVLDDKVQALMDDLDIPPERAQLFDVLDADGSGFLRATEILDGLMKVRGETRKSDTVGPLLAVRALQNQVRGVRATVCESYESLAASIKELKREMSPNRARSDLADGGNR